MRTIDTNKLPLFSRKLRKLRQNNHLTQEQLAKKVGMARAMITYLETKAYNPTAEVIRKFADFFQVSSDFFIYDSESEIKHPGPKSTFERQIEELRKLPQAKRKLANDLLKTVLNNSHA